MQEHSWTIDARAYECSADASLAWVHPALLPVRPWPWREQDQQKIARLASIVEPLLETALTALPQRRWRACGLIQGALIQGAQVQGAQVQGDLIQDAQVQCAQVQGTQGLQGAHGPIQGAQVQALPLPLPQHDGLLMDVRLRFGVPRELQLWQGAQCVIRFPAAQSFALGAYSPQHMQLCVQESANAACTWIAEARELRMPPLANWQPVRLPLDAQRALVFGDFQDCGRPPCLVEALPDHKHADSACALCERASCDAVASQLFSR